MIGVYACAMFMFALIALPVMLLSLILLIPAFRISMLLVMILMCGVGTDVAMVNMGTTSIVVAGAGFVVGAAGVFGGVVWYFRW